MSTTANRRKHPEVLLYDNAQAVEFRTIETIESSDLHCWERCENSHRTAQPGGTAVRMGGPAAMEVREGTVLTVQQEARAEASK